MRRTRSSLKPYFRRLENVGQVRLQAQRPRSPRDADEKNEKVSRTLRFLKRVKEPTTEVVKAEAMCWIHPEKETERRKAVNEWVYVFCPCEDCPMWISLEEAERGPVQPVYEEIKERP